MNPKRKMPGLVRTLVSFILLIVAVVSFMWNLVGIAERAFETVTP